jgi:carbonic anhydrase
MQDRYDRRLSRRQLMRLAVMGTAGLVATARTLPAVGAPAPGAPPRDPQAILRDLLEGNRRFAGGQAAGPRRSPEDFAALAAGQTPEAIIVGCADSRVSPEILFDQGVGDLFVIRVAGNVVSNTGVIVKGSIEYAVAELGVPLVLVLGHSQCGAVKAALQHLEAKDALPGAIAGLVDVIKPAVAASRGKPGDPLDNAIRANVVAGVARLKSLPPIVAPAVKRGKLTVVGGVYDLKSGVVTMIG